MRNQIVHRWYTRPVLFVADVNRAIPRHWPLWFEPELLEFSGRAVGPFTRRRLAPLPAQPNSRYRR
jgi:hypothetical protein